jgi:hypothetical protein
MNGVKRCTDTPKKKARERNHHHTLPEAPYIEICRQRFSEGCKTARTVIGLLSGYLTVKAILNPDAVKAAVHYHQPITAKEPGEEHTEDDGWLHFRGVYFLFCREVSLSFRHSIGDSKVPEQEYEMALLPVTSNLFCALTHLRLPDRQRCLWVDAQIKPFRKPWSSRSWI